MSGQVIGNNALLSVVIKKRSFPTRKGLLGEELGCGFLQTVKDDSNENSLS